MNAEENSPGQDVNSEAPTETISPQISDVNELAAERSRSDKIDQFEEKAASLPQLTGHRVDLFPDQQYVRILTMPAGTFFTSQIHKTEHPYFALSGVVSVYTAGKGWSLVRGGDYGITTPGTRRLLVIHEEATWATVHLDLDRSRDPEAIGQRIILPHDIKASELDPVFMQRLLDEGMEYLSEHPYPFAQ